MISWWYCYNVTVGSDPRTLLSMPFRQKTSMLAYYFSPDPKQVVLLTKYNQTVQDSNADLLGESSVFDPLIHHKLPPFVPHLKHKM